MAKNSKKRKAIINSAISEFKAKGFKDTSMDQIALTANVSKRTVYNHFASKDILFDAIIDEMLMLFNASISIQYSATEALANQLQDIAQQELQLLADPAFVDLAKVIMAETIHSPARINQALEEVEKRDGNLSAWIMAAQKDQKLIAVDVDFAAAQFFALLKVFCFWPQVIQGQAFPDTEQQQQIIASAVSMFLKQYQLHH
ncbi:TetR/AcrR family transcriptional regulator [Paraglaciecola aquimarina]|uniref:TetR/AcrR family transcriptional regulator n=1 Tax=Paraglaciecola aquimarina TaxID=1235557 RepID=A0ABU3T105_9ALTE|nr:TetR/AcrR family transcriptional regulator [Paraglaciecola aquimarina]MDU0355931.1 TetR/AcrR family transcriptional regulator [Paraglaciecola aquimarina]